MDIRAFWKQMFKDANEELTISFTYEKEEKRPKVKLVKLDGKALRQMKKSHAAGEEQYYKQLGELVHQEIEKVQRA